ncbi:complex I intermediate-associated protein 30-domain-containing protein [Xylaria flabelliformis]|nr:complex I intermediate-associated protein 30-domain-containing protein [Xylaria flabelliformis]
MEGIWAVYKDTAPRQFEAVNAAVSRPRSGTVVARDPHSTTSVPYIIVTDGFLTFCLRPFHALVTSIGKRHLYHGVLRFQDMTLSKPDTYLFGGDKPWLAEDWVASDDRVRGGKSQSYLDYTSESKEAVRFHGELDITALGGAGFASERSPDPQHWDLSSFQGLHLAIGKGDGKKYTLIVKDEILPKRPDGREQSTVSWEYDFLGTGTELDIPWQDLTPTYRGKPKLDAKPLDLGNIKRISIMMRSFFGEQEGPFDLEVQHIAAVLQPDPKI